MHRFFDIRNITTQETGNWVANNSLEIQAVSAILMVVVTIALVYISFRNVKTTRILAEIANEQLSMSKRPYLHITHVSPIDNFDKINLKFINHSEVPVILLAGTMSWLSFKDTKSDLNVGHDINDINIILAKDQKTDIDFIVSVPRINIPRENTDVIFELFYKSVLDYSYQKTIHICKYSTKNNRFSLEGSFVEYIKESDAKKALDRIDFGKQFTKSIASTNL